MSVILHLIQQEKITQDIINNFSLLSNRNIFLVFKQESIIVIENGETVNLDYDINDPLNDIVSRLSVSGILVHGLYHRFARLINGLRKPIKIGWFAWGFDVYNLPRIRPSIYADATNRYLRAQERKHSIIQKIKQNDVSRRIAYLFSGKKDPYAEVTESYRKIDFFCSYIKEDFDVFCTYYKTDIQFRPALFCSMDQYLAGNQGLRISADAGNILIGNSNSAENNHLDVLNALKKYKADLKHLIVPLSYGNNNRYKEAVLENGKSIFESRFQPLTDFMSRDTYLDLLRSCSAGIFYHYRQQAMGNIIALLYMGARVYLSSKNPVFHFLQRNNIKIFDFDKEFELYKNSRLQESDAEHNRDSLDQIFSKQDVLKSLETLVAEF